MLQEVIERSLSRVQKALLDPKTISWTQFLIALVWMIRCEIDANPMEQTLVASKPKKDLMNNTDKAVMLRDTQKDLLRDKKSIILMNLLDCPDPSVAPENYFGNAFITPFIEYKERQETLDEPPLMHVLVNACLATQTAFEQRKSRSSVAENIISIYRAANDQAMVANFPLSIKSCTCYFNLPQKDEFDFGQGPPCFLYTPPSFPLFSYSNAFCTQINKDGVFLSLVVPNACREKLLNSQVIRECANGAHIMLGHQSQQTYMQHMQPW